MSVKGSVKRLQSGIGVNPDGYWGGLSQEALEASYKLDFDFAKFKKLFNTSSVNQGFVDGVNGLFAAFNNYKELDSSNPLYVAYMLATAYHETAFTFLPLREYGRGKGKPYGSNIDIDGTRYTGLNHTYYGRGYVQLTWLSNYKKMGDLLGVDLVNNPDKAMEPSTSAKILVMGCLRGLFTGKRLSDYIKYGVNINEFKQARRVVNGMDKASLIADYAVKFLQCITIQEVRSRAENDICPCCHQEIKA